MPLWDVTVEKYFAGANEYWVNNYNINAASGDDAVPVISAFVNAEKALYDSAIVITKVRISSSTPDDDAFYTSAVNVAGTRTAGTGDRSPLFVVARVDFSVAWQRPSRKYLRGIFSEGDITFSALIPGITTVLSTYATAILAITGICDEHGNTFNGASVWPAPAMRQLRRGSKKKSTL